VIRCYFLLEGCCRVSVGRPLWQEDESAVCSAITQWFESCRTRNLTLLSHLRLPQTAGPSYTPRHWVPFTSPLTTRRWRYSNPPPTSRARSPYIFPPVTGWSGPKSKTKFKVTLRGQPKSRSHITTDSQSVSMSGCRAHSGTYEEILLSVRRLLSESCCLVSVGRPLWRKGGAVICHYQCIAIYQYLHRGFTFLVFLSSAKYILQELYIT
jgi:hypothetical protein